MISVHDVPGEYWNYYRLIIGMLRKALETHLHNLKFYGLERAKDMEAARWFTTDREGPFTFNWTCDLLRVNPEKFRANMYSREYFFKVKQELSRLQFRRGEA